MTIPDKVKKTLVRNPEQPKTIAGATLLPQKTSKAEPAPVSTKTNTKPDGNPRFDVPEMHSTLQLSKKIDDIVKPRQTKSLSDMHKIKLAPDDKVTRHVNFPHDQPVFKDLIPLGEGNEVEPEPFTATRDPDEETDPEPNFDDFLNYKRKQINYYCEPEIVLKGLDDVEDEDDYHIIDNNPFKLYNILLNCQYPKGGNVLKERISKMKQ